MFKNIFKKKKKSKKDAEPQGYTPATGSSFGAPPSNLQPPLSSRPPNAPVSPTSTPSTPSTPSPFDIFRTRGDDRAQSGDYNGAVVMYDEALTYAPTDVNLLLSRSFAHSMTTPPRFDLALKDAGSAIQQSPDNWQAWLQLGETKSKMGDLAAAEEALVNAVGFADGINKLTANRSLGDFREKKAARLKPQTVTESEPLISSVAETSTTSTSTPTPTPKPASETSTLPIRPATTPASSRPTPNVATTSTATTPAVSSTPPSFASQPPPPPVSPRLSNLPSSSSIPAASTQPNATRPLSQVTGSWTFGRQPNTQQSPAPAPAPATTTTTPPSTQAARRPVPTPTTPAPNPASGTPSGSQVSTPSSTNTTSTARPTPAASTASNPTRTAPIQLAHDSTTVTQAPATPNINPLVDSLLSSTSPADAPPGYTPSYDNPDPAVRALSQQALQAQINELITKLQARNKGALSLRPSTAPGNIDSLSLVYGGMTQQELTARELGIPTYLHPVFQNMHISTLSFPGNTWLDMDPESSAYYDGKLPGTVGVRGYSEEYRSHQLLQSPMLNLTLESNTVLPVIPLDKIVQRLQTLRIFPTNEDNEGLRGFLGISQLTALQLGFLTNRQRQIESICMGLNRSLFDAPARFANFAKARNISNNTFGTAAQGICLHNFLYQILLGAELVIRLRKEPITTSYASLITDPISALVVLSSLWMKYVAIQATPVASTSTSIAPASNYTLFAMNNAQQIQALIRFGEALSWPLMDEARAYIENSYQTLIVNSTSVGFDICDWLFGLILPGKIFRHRIMCCLVYASPTIRTEINSAPYYDNGLIVRNKSYWPQRSVLGRVLGGLRNPKSVCGWIGPVPAPEGWSGTSTAWIRLNARRVDIPAPVSRATGATGLESLGYDMPEGGETPDEAVQSVLDPEQWIPSPGPAPRNHNNPNHTQFKGLRLAEVAGTTGTLQGTTIPTLEHRATILFDINGKTISYVLYANPVFLAAPPCVGNHLMHKRQASKCLKEGTLIRATDLKDADVEQDKMIVIDAQGQGEEAVARAWCAERARHAVVRRGEGCCFSCAVGMTERSVGLGVNVLIWSC